MVRDGWEGWPSAGRARSHEPEDHNGIVRHRGTRGHRHRVDRNPPDEELTASPTRMYMNFGYLIGVVIQGALVALTLTAPRRPRLLAGLGYRVASAYNEAPFPIHLPDRDLDH
jgi:hypothetical protein